MNPLLAVLLLAFIAINKAEATPSLLSLCHPQTNCKAVERLWNGQDTIVTGWLKKPLPTIANALTGYWRAIKPR
jgi:hypothetical protein